MATYHICIDIKDALRWSDRKIAGLLCDSETKRELSPAEIRDFLRKQLEAGKSKFSGCDNIKEDGSCAGH